MSALDRAVANEVVVVAHMSDSLPALISLAEECEALAAASTARHETQRRFALLKKARALRDEVHRISSKTYESRVAELSTKYALSACLASDSDDEASRTETVMGDELGQPLRFEAAHKPSACGTIARNCPLPPSKRPRIAKPSEKAFATDFLAETANAEPRVLLQQQGEVCPCGGKLLVTPTKALVRCQVCGAASTILDSVSASLSFDESYSSSSFSYERLSHFLDHLARAQGKSVFTPPESLLLQIMEQLKVDNIAPADLSIALVRATMKHLKISSKTREHAPMIYSKLSGKPLPQLDAADEDKLRLQFLAMQAPFTKHVPASRKNFVSYSVCLHRLLILNGFDELLDSVALLAGRGKTEAQDAMLRLIFGELGWEFSTTTTPR